MVAGVSQQRALGFKEKPIVWRNCQFEYGLSA